MIELTTANVMVPVILTILVCFWVRMCATKKNEKNDENGSFLVRKATDFHLIEG